MKLSNTTLLALLATSAFVSAAPAVNVETGTTMVKRTDANEILDLIAEIKSIKSKRDLVTDEEMAMLDKRAESVIGELISALASSGIIGDVWNTITTDPTLTSEIKTIAEAAIKGAIAYGPSLLEALLSSGLLSTVFHDILNDSALRTALLDAAKALFTDGINLLIGSSSSSGATTTTAAAAATTTAAAKREILESDSEYLDDRDLSSIVTWVVTEIKNSGILSELISKVTADPAASLSFFESVFKQGLVVAEDVYSWSKSSGLLSQMISYLEANGTKYLGTLGTVLGEVLGAFTGSSSTGSTTTATTASAANVAVTNTAIAATGTDESVNSALAIAQEAVNAITTVTALTTATTLVRRAY